jgi:parvulin-like peptidyl-prolyl isomerase
MRHGVFPVILLVVMFLAAGCRQGDVIVEGDDLLLTVDQLRFEVSKLGPGSSYEDTYQDRYATVLNLATREFLADEAERRGYGGEELQRVVKNAEKAAVAEVYRRWKVENAVMLPRVKSKPWIEKLDRKLHLKDLVFLVRPVADEALAELRAGVSLSDIEEAASGRDDVRVTDLGWVVWKDLSREVANIVFRLDPGEASDVVTGNDGHHIFFLVEGEPFDVGLEILSVRSRRFVRAMEEEKILRDLRNELASKYDVGFLEKGLADGLKAFAISFTGERPPDLLMATAIAEYPMGQVTVGDLYSLYFSMPDANRPYVGDYYALKDFAFQLLMPELEALAGYELGLDRGREVRFAARKAREEYLVPSMEDYFKSQVEITPRDIEEYYQERGNDLFEPELYRARRLMVDSWEKARQAHRQILMGMDFVDAVRQFSEDEQATSKDGELGWLNTGLVASYDSVLADMEPGDISRPFETYSGIEILRLEERQPRRLLTFEEAAPRIRVYITNTRANEMLTEFVDRKQDEIGFTLNEELLRDVRLPTPEYARRRHKAGVVSEDEEEPPTVLPKLGGR